ERGDRPEGAPPEGAEGGPAPEPSTMSGPDAATHESAPPPREPGADDSPYMSSAEHRTDKDSTDHGDSQGGSGIDDELCFQPREPKRPAQAPPPAVVEEYFQPSEPEPTFGLEESTYEPEPMASEESHAHDFPSEVQEQVH